MKFETKTKSLMYGMEFTHGARRAIVSALGLLYFFSFGFSLISITTLFSISTIIMLFFEFPTAAIADYDSRKKSLLISFFLMFLAFFGIFFFKTFWPLAFSWILADIAWTFCSGANYAWVIDTLGYSGKKLKIISIISKSSSFEKAGRAIGGLIGLVLVLINFRFVWLLISLSYLFFLFIFWKYAEERNFKKIETHHHFLKKPLIQAKKVFGYLFKKENRQIRNLNFIDMLNSASLSAFFVCLPLVFSQSFGISTSNISGIYAGLAVVVIFGPMLAGKLGALKTKSLLVSFTALVGACMLSFVYSSILLVSLIFLVLLEIFMTSYNTSLDSACHHLFPSKIRASLGSMTNILWAISHASAVFLAGISISFLGLRETVFICGLILLLSATLFFFKLGGTK
ncbi:MAG: MFS transporter [archaeon]